MAGYGKQPAGRSSAGFGSPATATAPSGTMLSNTAPGANANVSTGARKIDPKSRDYVVDSSTGRLLGMPSTHQAVQLAVHTEKFSAAVKDMGQELRKIDRVTSNFERRVLNTLTAALQTAIDLGLVEVLGFSSFKAGVKDGLQAGQTYGRLRWRDLSTGQEQQELI